MREEEKMVKESSTVKLRRVEVLQRDGKWREIMFHEIQKGDVFRLFDENTGFEVETGIPSVALSAPKQLEGINWECNCEEIPENRI
jgi:hypothetical protein